MADGGLDAPRRVPSNVHRTQSADPLGPRPPRSRASGGHRHAPIRTTVAASDAMAGTPALGRGQTSSHVCVRTSPALRRVVVRVVGVGGCGVGCLLGVLGRLLGCVDLVAEVGDVVLDDRELSFGRALVGADALDLRLDFGQAVVDFSEVVLRRARCRARGLVDLVAEIRRARTSWRSRPARREPGRRRRCRRRAPAPRRRARARKRVWSLRSSWATQARTPSSFSFGSVESAASCGVFVVGRGGGGGVPASINMGLGPATSPSSGSSGRPCSAHAAMPPVML